MLHARMSSVADYSITKSQIDDLMILTMMTIKQQTDETPAGSYVRYIKNAHSSTASSSSSSSTMHDTYALGTQVRRLFVNRVVQQLGPIPYTVCTTITHRERICCSRRAFSHSTHTQETPGNVWKRSNCKQKFGLCAFVPRAGSIVDLLHLVLAF